MSLPLGSKPSISAAAVIPPDPDPDPPPPKSTSAPGFLWSNLFANPTSSHVPSSSPSFLPDGTPVVLAPPSVILKASATWAGHLLCRFMGEPPSPGKFFNDLNRIWGKNGDISVRRFSSGTFLVHVPSAGTRKWILQTGLWSSGTVSFVVSEWSVNASLAAPPRLTSATTVLTIRNIPPQLWSHEAVARIAGGVATLIPDARAFLPRSSLGTATIRAIVPLGSSLPPSVLVKDSNGNSVLVSVDYGKLPHLCPNCNSYGHQVHRCPKKSVPMALNDQPSSTQVGNNVSEVPLTDSTNPSITPVAEIDMEVEGPSSITTELPQLHQHSVATTDGVINSFTEANNLESTSLTEPIIVEVEMEVEQSQQHLLSSHMKPLLQDSTQSTMLKEDPELQTNIAPSPTEIHTQQVPPPNTHPLDLMLPESIDPHVIPVLPCEFSTPQKETNNQTSSVAAQTDFTYPPPSSCALHPVNDSLDASKSSSDCTLVQFKLDTHSPVKKERNGVKRKTTFDSKASLRCTQVSHPFKPKGTVEKRRKKRTSSGPKR